MPQLRDGIGSGNGQMYCHSAWRLERNGGSGVSSVLGGKHKSDADDSLASSKNSKNNAADIGFVQLSTSIEKHSQSLVAAAPRA
jgi:hypothetical protein